MPKHKTFSKIIKILDISLEILTTIVLLPINIVNAIIDISEILSK